MSPFRTEKCLRSKLRPAPAPATMAARSMRMTSSRKNQSRCAANCSHHRLYSPTPTSIRSTAPCQPPRLIPKRLAPQKRHKNANAPTSPSRSSGSPWPMHRQKASPQRAPPLNRTAVHRRPYRAVAHCVSLRRR